MNRRRRRENKPGARREIPSNRGSSAAGRQTSKQATDLQKQVGNRAMNEMLSPLDSPESSEEMLRATQYQSVHMHFDGQDLIVYGNDRMLFRYDAQSGRPIQVSEEDASECGADQRTSSYMNDRRFVGIKMKGPIPEGTYTFSPPAIVRFSTGEQLDLMLGGVLGRERVQTGAGSIHAGDWGSGRVALHPRGRLREGPCGGTNRRGDFFLHGGIMSGSSGCIDVGGDFGELAEFLAGYRGRITLTVAYEHEPPSVGFFTGLSGALAYQSFHLSHDLHLRLGTEFAPGSTRFLASPGYDLLLNWAGGALTAGVRLDIPLNDREAFVRAGLRGGAEYRLLGVLYGRLFGGYSFNLTGNDPSAGLELGAGLKVDLNRVQLEALYNVLKPFSEDERGHQILLGVGFRF